MKSNPKTMFITKSEYDRLRKAIGPCRKHYQCQFVCVYCNDSVFVLAAKEIERLKKIVQNIRSMAMKGLYE